MKWQNSSLEGTFRFRISRSHAIWALLDLQIGGVICGTYVLYSDGDPGSDAVPEPEENELSGGINRLLLGVGIGVEVEI
jgi:hypothetical protein